MELIAYPLSGVQPNIRPAPSRRGWIDELPGSYANRCLPLMMANQMGWLICAPVRTTVVWDGNPGVAALTITSEREHPLRAESHFGAGIVTWHIGALFQTPPGINLLITGPLNLPKDGAQALSGVIETDWSPYTFTMNWMLTAEGEIIWEEGEPIAQIIPTPRNLANTMQPTFRDLDSSPDLAQQYRTWAASRDTFNADLKVPGSDAAAQGWQKNYFRGFRPDGTPGVTDHQTKAPCCPFSGATRKF